MLHRNTLPSVLNHEIYLNETNEMAKELASFIKDAEMVDMMSLVDITAMDRLCVNEVKVILVRLGRCRDELELRHEQATDINEKAELRYQLQKVSTAMQRFHGRQLFREYAMHEMNSAELHHHLQHNLGGNLSYLNLESAHLNNANLSGFNLGHINLRQAQARNVNFKDAKFLRAIMAHAMLESSTFKRANLHAVDFTAANLRATIFEDADCTEAQFIQANLSSAFLLSTNMRRANLGSAKLINAILDDTQFIDANLRAANLKGANFRRVNFSGADLSFSNLIGTNLAAARFTDAKLDHAEFVDPAMFRLHQLEYIMERLNVLGEMIESHPDKALLKRAISTNVADLLDNLKSPQERDALSQAVYHHRIFQHTHVIARSINRFSAYLSRSANGYLETPEQNKLSEYKRRTQ